MPIDRSSYYRHYYQQKKEQIKQKYLDKRKADKDENEMFREYGGVKKYYRDKLVEMGFLVITPISRL